MMSSKTYGPEAFPTADQIEGFWSFDKMHAPRPITPLSSQIILPTLSEGFTKAQAEYDSPIITEDKWINYYYFASFGPHRDPEVVADRLSRYETTLARQFPLVGPRWENEWKPPLIELVEKNKRADWSKLSNAELIPQFDWFHQHMAHQWYVHGHINFALLAAAAFCDMYDEIVSPTDVTESYQCLQGYHTRSVDASKALWNLGRLVRNDATLHAAFKDTPPKELMGVLALSEPGKKFLAEFDTYLFEFGWRSDAVYDMADITWIEDPSIPLGALGGYIDLSDSENPDQHLAKAVSRREKLMAAARAKIADDPEKVWTLTTKQHMVAVVTDGSAVLGLGDIGPEAALPVMEGKAMLFKEFGDLDAFPLCLATRDVDEIVAVVKAIAPGFGGINLEDIAAPRCFEIERRLRDELDIPVFHDDQHGTAIVVLAALLNALRVVGKRIENVKIVTTGCGAAGTAVTKILLAAGARTIIGCDENGALYRGRPDLTDAKREYAELTNRACEHGTADEMLADADVFIGVSVPGAVTRKGVERMAPGPIVFALANPSSEVEPEEVEDIAAVIATGRSDYPNQINNVLAFPGVFRGALEVRASAITPEMELAAASALAGVIPRDELSADYIVPSVFDRTVAPAVARAVSDAAIAAGVARHKQEVVR